MSKKNVTAENPNDLGVIRTGSLVTFKPSLPKDLISRNGGRSVINDLLFKVVEVDQGYYGSKGDGVIIKVLNANLKYCRPARDAIVPISFVELVSPERLEFLKRRLSWFYMYRKLSVKEHPHTKIFKELPVLLKEKTVSLEKDNLLKAPKISVWEKLNDNGQEEW